MVQLVRYCGTYGASLFELKYCEGSFREHDDVQIIRVRSRMITFVISKSVIIVVVRGTIYHPRLHPDKPPSAVHIVPHLSLLTYTFHIEKYSC